MVQHRNCLLLKKGSLHTIIMKQVLPVHWRIFMDIFAQFSELCYQTIPVCQLRWLNSKFIRPLNTAWDPSFVTHSDRSKCYLHPRKLHKGTDMRTEGAYLICFYHTFSHTVVYEIDNINNFQSLYTAKSFINCKLIKIIINSSVNY